MTSPGPGTMSGTASLVHQGIEFGTPTLERFVDQVVWSEKSDYRELILADYLLLNERLAKFYGVPLPAGGGFQPVKFDPAQRAGVLTHPYLLARLAHPDRR